MVDKLRQQGEHEDYSEEGPAGRSARLIWGLRAAGLIAALLVYVALGASEGLRPDARWVATVATLMAVWWMTAAQKIHDLGGRQ